MNYALELSCWRYPFPRLPRPHCLQSLSVLLDQLFKKKLCHLLPATHTLLHKSRCQKKLSAPNTEWCSEIGSLMSLDVPELHASTDVREPISLHQAVVEQSHTSHGFNTPLHGKAMLAVCMRIEIPPWSKSKSLQPRNSWGWSAVWVCDIVRHWALVWYLRDRVVCARRKLALHLQIEI